jgi:hypothetical protein
VLRPLRRLADGRNLFDLRDAEDLAAARERSVHVRRWREMRNAAASSALREDP